MILTWACLLLIIAIYCVFEKKYKMNRFDICTAGLSDEEIFFLARCLTSRGFEDVIVTRNNISFKGNSDKVNKISEDRDNFLNYFEKRGALWKK